MKVISAKSGISENAVKESLARIMQSSSLCSIATVNCDDGAPHINTCFFSYSENFQLYLFTSPKTLHARNLESKPSCAINIFSTNQKMGDNLLGCQLFGTAKMLNPILGLRAFNNYVHRFNVFSTWADTLDTVLSKFESRFYEFEICSGKILDESAFGKEEYVSFKIQI